jgi:hypothetical protein
VIVRRMHLSSNERGRERRTLPPVDLVQLVRALRNEVRAIGSELHANHASTVAAECDLQICFRSVAVKARMGRFILHTLASRLPSVRSPLRAAGSTKRSKTC